MRRASREALASRIYDREHDGEDSSATTPEVQEQLSWFQRLSSILRVPSDVGEADPGFVARFRVRRDALLEAYGNGHGWRWLTLRLVPLSACALLTTGLVVWASNEASSVFSELEARELGDGLVDVTYETAEVEPVLRIALGEL